MPSERIRIKSNSNRLGNFLKSIFMSEDKKPKPGPLRRGNRVLVLDLYQIKGGLRLYLLLDLDY